MFSSYVSFRHDIMAHATPLCLDRSLQGAQTPPQLCLRQQNNGGTLSMESTVHKMYCIRSKENALKPSLFG